MFAKAFRVLDNFCVSSSISFCNCLQNSSKPGSAISIIRREICTAEYRFACRQEKHSHWPPTASCHDLNGCHVDLVQIRALFAVLLDVHEVAVHELRNRLVFEGLVLHHVTPVTCRIPDAEQNRLVLASSTLQSFGPPRIPVDGVMSVLEKIGTSFDDESIGHKQPPPR